MKKTVKRSCVLAFALLISLNLFSCALFEEPQTLPTVPVGTEPTEPTETTEPPEN